MVYLLKQEARKVPGFFSLSHPGTGSMKILALSDQVIQSVYSPQVRDLYGGVDLVIGCGDLPYYYLEYVATQLTAQVVYVFGNHDRTQFMSDGRILKAPEGCVPLEGRSVPVKGLLLAGLGGSMRYTPSGAHQYTDGQMWGRILGLTPQLMINRLTRGRFVDILVTHSPPYGIHDGEDLAHTGFKSFLAFMRYFKPRYLLHGHKHCYRRDIKEKTSYYQTEVVNVYPKHMIDWE
jgi:Icc-related predicted phosphoesterase